jgi:CRISPR-associated protein (TIGR02584 family)
MPVNITRSKVRRNVLVAVAGHTPAIITETLWALEQQRRVRIDEIRIITTADGRDSIVSELFGETGQFARYCEDYNVPTGRIE